MTVITELDALKRLVKDYQCFDAFAVDTETVSLDPAFPATDPRTNHIIWISLATYGRSDSIPIGHPLGELVRAAWKERRVPEDPAKRKVLKNGKLSEAKTEVVNHPAEYSQPPEHLQSVGEVLEVLEPLFFGPALKIAHNVKFDMETIAKYYGRLPTGPWGETMVAQHLLNENLLKYDLEFLMDYVFGYKYPKLGKKGVENFPFSEAALYTLRDARSHWMLWHRCAGLADKRGFGDLLRTVEMPVCRAFAQAEMVGAPIDTTKMDVLHEALNAEIAQIEDGIRDLNGGELFNLNANQAKIDFIYGKLGLKPWRVSKKTQVPSVDKIALEPYEAVPGVDLLIRHAKVAKLRGTYVEGLTKLLHEGRLHPNFTQHSTVTGRAACREPNLHNIPQRGEAGSQVRELFVPPSGYAMVVVDYGQIELRVLAHFTQDPGLKRVFANGEDIHRATAAAALRKPPEEVSKAERGIGKGLAFAIGYGAGPDKVALMTGYTTDQAAVFIAEFFAQFPAVKRWKTETIRKARSYEYPFVTTILGRKRRLADLRSPYNGPRARAERQAINAVIQGSAADINKLAIVHLDQALEANGCYEDPWLQFVINVHDEFVCFVREDRADEGLAIARDAMLSVDVLGDVPLEADGKLCYRWSEGK